LFYPEDTLNSGQRFYTLPNLVYDSISNGNQKDLGLGSMQGSIQQ